jgi:CheY-like chemotaxis protein
VRLDGLRLLVVDDEAYARSLLLKLLQRAGAVVAAASSAAEALEMLPKVQPHVLVSDIGMPGMDGLDLIREVRGRGGHDPATLPAIALTAYVQPEDARAAPAAGFQVHVSKPVDLHALTATIARLAVRPG